VPFKPQTMFWPGTRAVLLVHGIGDASTGKDGAFPLDVLESVLGDDADVAIYRINYDFINDWLKTKLQFEAGITAFKAALKLRLGDQSTDETIAEYAGDVLWPVLSADLRFAVRDAMLAQLDQIQIDRGESALERGDDPLDYQVSVIAHSLGCFHAYEVLTAAANEPAHKLQPASDLFTLHNVILMASPVQLIRTVAGAIGALVPDRNSLATLAAPLAIPSETRNGKVTPITTDFMSITGNDDPVGGFLIGTKLDWAYMDIPGQNSTIVSQQLLNIGTKDLTAQALASAFSAGGPKVNDPHSWSAYIQGQAKLLRGALLT
jgi:hypothetical protein